MDIYERVVSEAQSVGEFSVIGKSELGCDIVCTHCGGYGGKQLIITGGIHARECYTALVVLEQVRIFGDDGDDGAYFVPLVNPDGARFFESGKTAGSEYLESMLSLRREWKANGKGVDLNCNFDANWGGGIGNTGAPSSHGYIGKSPASAAEVKALCDFTRSIKPCFTVSYHCMGGELYWEYGQEGERYKREKKLATAIARRARVKRVDGDLGSAGGYKDWCVQKLGIPAVTIELIKRGSHPFRESDFAEEIKRNAHLPRFIMNRLDKLIDKRPAD